MAATTIGDLAVRVGADTTGLVKGLSDSSKRIDQFGSKIRKSTNDFGKYATAAAAAGVAIGTVLVKQQLKAIDSLAKTSDKLGVTTEALTSLRFAAELTGVASNTLDMALQRMTRRVAEAAMGTGEAKDAIKQLGLNAQELASLSPDRAFQKIAGAMENVGTQGEKVRLAFKLFDSEGVALVNTLALGEQGLQDMAAEADRLGVSISRIEAAQVEAANDALTRAGAVMEGALRRATVDLAPVIEAVANEFVNAASETNNFGTAAIDTVQAILTPIGILMDGIHGVRVAVKGLEATFVGLGFGAISSWNMIVKGYTELANLIPGIDVDFKETFLGKLEQSAADATTAAVNELHELAMTKLPSHEIDDWLDRVRNASEVAAKAVAANRDAIIGGSVGGELGDPASGDRISKLAEQYKTEEELRKEFNANMLALDKAHNEGRLAGEAEYLALKNQLILEDQAALSQTMIALSQEEAEKRRQIEQQVSDSISAMKFAVANQAIGLAKMVADDSKGAALAILAVEKGLAIASTFINTQVAAMRALAELGPIAGAAAAAKIQTLGKVQMGLIAATGLAQAAGGGGGVSGVNSAVQQGQAQAGAAQSSRVVNVTLEGQSFSGDQVRDLIERINEAQEDGTAIVRFS